MKKKTTSIICITALIVSTALNIISLFVNIYSLVTVIPFAISCALFVYRGFIGQEGYSKKEKMETYIVYLIGLVWVVTFFLYIKYN